MAVDVVAVADIETDLLHCHQQDSRNEGTAQEDHALL